MERRGCERKAEEGERNRREKQDGMEGKARVGAGCKREGQVETEIAMRPS